MRRFRPGKRDRILLLAAGAEVLWVLGGRMNADYKITPQTQKDIGNTDTKEEKIIMSEKISVLLDEEDSRKADL